ncbi:MAG: DUF2520 domain-containing protein [Cytophagales bacterium]|nr:DUF2520 domain-containing protein [Cytophagales bacterium]
MANSIAILGSGNMAFQLLTAFDKASVPLRGLISRDLSRGATTLEATSARCELVGGRDLSDLETDLIILAVPDDAIEEVLRFYQFHSDHILIHTSGAASIDLIRHERAGVFYPLQTFTWGEAVDFSGIPILIEGSSLSVEEALTELAQSVSKTVQMTSSEDRLKMHVAAVMVSNFTNHLYHRAEKWLVDSELSMDILYPLIDETLRKAKELGPVKAQTGPAKRGDQKTLSLHENLIQDSALRKLYHLISEDIKNI